MLTVPLFSLTFCIGGRWPEGGDFHIYQGVSVEKLFKVSVQAGHGTLVDHPTGA